jgi:hypothetical protein
VVDPSLLKADYFSNAFCQKASLIGPVPKAGHFVKKVTVQLKYGQHAFMDFEKPSSNLYLILLRDRFHNFLDEVVMANLPWMRPRMMFQPPSGSLYDRLR